MTQEEKLKEAKRLYETANSDQRYVLETLFPELKESGDEKIRKALIRFHKSTIDIDGIKGADVIAWLEKQGEYSGQIHYWTEEEIEPIISDYLRGVEHYGGMIGRLRCLKPRSLEKQGEQNPIWSEEDEIGLTNTIIMLKEGASLHFSKKDITKAVDWLKSLKQRIGE